MYNYYNVSKIGPLVFQLQNVSTYGLYMFHPEDEDVDLWRYYKFPVLSPQELHVSFPCSNVIWKENFGSQIPQMLPDTN